MLNNVFKSSFLFIIQIASLDAKINTVEQSFQQTLDVYNETIFEELDSISKMQGPRGYNGSDGMDGADLEQCTYNMNSQGSSVTADLTSTPEIYAGTVSFGSFFIFVVFNSIFR